MRTAAAKISEQELASIRQDLGAPSRAAIAWNEVFTPSEKRMILKSTGLVDDLQHKRWDNLHPMYQGRIRETVRRWVRWASDFAGVF